jgi:hypothetical protein
MNSYFEIDIESPLDPFVKIVAPFLDSYISFKPIDDLFLDLAHLFIKSLYFFPPISESEKVLRQHRELVENKFKEIPRVKNSLDNQLNVWLDEIDKSINPAMAAMNFTFDFLKQFNWITITSR